MGLPCSASINCQSQPAIGAGESNERVIVNIQAANGARKFPPHRLRPFRTTDEKREQEE